MGRLLILVMLASACGFAQTRWPIQKLSVEGNQNYTAEQVLTVSGLKVGQLAGKPEFDAARDRLLASGAFEMVGYKFGAEGDTKGYQAVFQVTEVPTAYPVRFDGLGVPAKDLEAALHARDVLFSAERVPASKTVLDRYVNWIQELLAARGAPEKVKAEVTPTGPDKFVIVFRPARNLPAVARVTFEGNQVVQQHVLQDAIWPSAVGLAYTEEAFRNLLETAIRPIYEARGRIRVSFPKIRTEAVNDVEGVKVFVTVDESEVYSLGKMTIEGPTPVNPTELLKTGDFKTGDMANFDKVNEGIDRIQKAVRRAGYLEAKVTSTRKIDDAKKTVDVALHIDAGPVFSMGKLTFAGLDLEGEAEMNRMWGLKTGKPFNPEYPDFFLNRVKEQGVFDHLGATKAETTINNDHNVDVKLTFGADDPKTKPGRHGRGGGAI